jgi:hypothetical protein
VFVQEEGQRKKKVLFAVQTKGHFENWVLLRVRL